MHYKLLKGGREAVFIYLDLRGNRGLEKKEEEEKSCPDNYSNSGGIFPPPPPPPSAPETEKKSPYFRPRKKIFFREGAAGNGVFDPPIFPLPFSSNRGAHQIELLWASGDGDGGSGRGIGFGRKVPFFP